MVAEKNIFLRMHNIILQKITYFLQELNEKNDKP